MSTRPWMVILTLGAALAGCGASPSAPDSKSGRGGGNGQASGGKSGGNPGAGGSGALTDDAQLFAQATADFNAQKFTVARGEFETLLAQFPKTSYADKATVYIAVIDFELKDVAKAKGELMAFLKDFPA